MTENRTARPLAWIEAHRKDHIEDLKEILRIPSISTDPARKADVERAGKAIMDRLVDMGFRAELSKTAGHPVVYAEWLKAPGQPTVLIYGHYDVQPVDPLDLWVTPPFEPTVRDGRLYARGAVDDKGQVHFHLRAVRAWMETEGALPINIKFVVEGEEEAGSEHLDEWLLANREKVKADLVVVSDTNMFDRGVPSLTTGLRGLCYLEIEVEGSNTDLHSGGFGGAVANPANVLARIIASLKDADGKILVPGVYDDVRPLSKREREEFARLPFDEEKFRKSIDAPALTGEKGFTILERLWARPTLDVNGMIAGYTGVGAKTVIAAKASAKISLRLVPDQDPQRVGDQVEAYILKLSPPTVRTRVIRHHGGRPSLTPLDHPAVEAAARAIEKASGKRPVFQREGGSIPVVASFQEMLGMPTVMMGFGLPDENAHAPNEWFDLGNYDLGMRSAAIFYDELRREPR